MVFSLRFGAVLLVSVTTGTWECVDHDLIVYKYM
jgi:hypothetical protein